MDLYFQEHDVTQGQSARPSTIAGLNHGGLLRLAGLIAQMAEAEGPERDNLNAQVQSLLTEFSQTDPSMPGKPPASAEAIRMLPVVNVRPASDGQVLSCPICTEEFEFNEPAKRLPCDHMFHSNCVVPWLKSHCTCPMCREELPTDDIAYEDEKKHQKRQAAVSQMQNLMYN